MTNPRLPKIWFNVELTRPHGHGPPPTAPRPVRAPAPRPSLGSLGSLTHERCTSESRVETSEMFLEGREQRWLTRDQRWLTVIFMV